MTKKLCRECREKPVIIYPQVYLHPETFDFIKLGECTNNFCPDSWLKIQFIEKELPKIGEKIFRLF